MFLLVVLIFFFTCYMEDVGALLALAVAAGVVRTLTRRRASRALSLPYLPPRPPRENECLATATSLPRPGPPARASASPSAA